MRSRLWMEVDIWSKVDVGFVGVVVGWLAGTGSSAWTVV
jgi:hypothetical protein